ncbi:MAG TPA: cupredoxin domain-containing protein [Thermoanaerobaculia bacterium]|nr:cupredoxin domain-containing protein [Thermoanaerobaculia bacterium]
MCRSRLDLDPSPRLALAPSSERSREARPLRSVAAIGTALVAALAIAAATFVADASQPTHDLTLVARDMAFYLPGSDQPNPRLEVVAEEAVRLTIVNRDPGIDHDVAIESLGVRSAAVPGDGSSTTIRFRAPREPGEHEYVCRLHGRMMRGKLVVR